MFEGVLMTAKQNLKEESNQSPSELINSLSFVAIDLETTGGNHQSDRIIEIGLVKIENLEITDELHFLINPDIPIPQFIQKLTSISPDDLENAPSIEDVIDEILEFIGDSIIVAHNISFDFPFLNAVLKRLDKEPLENRNICTNLMTKYMIPNILSSNLNYMSQIFDIPHDQAHRALEDAKACAHLLVKYLEVFIKKKIRKVNQLYYPRSKFELDRAHFKKEEKEEFLEQLKEVDCPCLISLKGPNGLQWATLPLSSGKDEYKLVEEFLKYINFNGLSIQLTGSFLEAFLTFNSHYNKFEVPVRMRILEHFIDTYLDGKAPEFDNKAFLKGLDQNNFLFMNHLIPGQMVCYSLFNLQYKNELIFRFPAHKKRVFNYVLSQSRRKSGGKKNTFKHPIQKDLFPFIKAFLDLKKEQKDKDYLFLKKDIIKEDKGKFFNYLHHFFAAEENQSEYPKKHL